MGVSIQRGGDIGVSKEILRLLNINAGPIQAARVCIPKHMRSNISCDRLVIVCGHLLNYDLFPKLLKGLCAVIMSGGR